MWPPETSCQFSNADLAVVTSFRNSIRNGEQRPIDRYGHGVTALPKDAFSDVLECIHWEHDKRWLRDWYALLHLSGHREDVSLVKVGDLRFGALDVAQDDELGVDFVPGRM